MKAILCESYGRPERVLKLKEIEKPAPTESQVLLKVEPASANISDYYGIAGFSHLFGGGLTRRRTPGLGAMSQVRWRQSEQVSLGFSQEMRCLGRAMGRSQSSHWPVKTGWRQSLQTYRLSRLPRSPWLGSQRSSAFVTRSGYTQDRKWPITERQAASERSRFKSRSRSERRLPASAARGTWSRLDRCRPCRRLHPRGFHTRRVELRLDLRHRGEPISLRLQKGA